jgi:hypothetical protein
MSFSDYIIEINPGGNMKFILKSLCVFCLTFTLIHSKPASAIVGLIVSQKIIKVVGGVIGGTGAIGVASGFITGAAATTLATGLKAVILIVYGAATMGIGLIILDGESEGNIEFQPLMLSDARELGINSDDLEIYNENVEMLNSIKETIYSELSYDENLDTAQLWDEYAQVIDPAAMIVAKKVVNKFLSNL